jgi:hypothetical protein
MGCGCKHPFIKKNKSGLGDVLLEPPPSPPPQDGGGLGVLGWSAVISLGILGVALVVPKR